MSKRFPRADVIERQLETIQETFESIGASDLDKLRGGAGQPRYGLSPRPIPAPEPVSWDGGVRSEQPPLLPPVIQPAPVPPETE